MSNVVVTKYACDLCGRKIEAVGTYSLPKGWVKIVVENLFLDRDWTDKHVCEKCVEEITSKETK